MNNARIYRHLVLLALVVGCGASVLVFHAGAGVFGSPDEAFRLQMIENLRSTSYADMLHFEYRHFEESGSSRFSPHGQYIREKNGVLLGQYRPYFPYLANLFYDGTDTRLLFVLPAAFSVLGAILFYLLCRLFIEPRAALGLSLFYALCTPFITYSFRLLDVNVAVTLVILSTYLILKTERRWVQLLGLAIGLLTFVFFKSETILYLGGLVLAALWTWKNDISPAQVRKTLIAIALTMLAVLAIGSQLEHVQKHILSMDVLLNNYLNLPKRLLVIDILYFDPQPFGLGIEGLLGPAAASPLHLAGIATILLLIFIVARLRGAGVLRLLGNRYFAGANIVLFLIALAVMLSHRSHDPVFLGRYSADLAAAIGVISLLIAVQAAYPLMLQRAAFRDRVASLNRLEFHVWAMLFTAAIVMILVQDKMVRGLFTATPILVFGLLSLHLQRVDTNTRLVRNLVVICLLAAVFAPTQGGFQWGPRYLQQIVPMMLLLAWLSYRGREEIADRIGISAKALSGYFLAFALLTALMTLKGVLFIQQDVDHREQNARTLEEVQADFILHKAYPVHYPGQIGRSYRLRHEARIVRLLELVDRTSFSFAIYDLNPKVIERRLTASQGYDFSSSPTGLSVVDLSPDSDRRLPITVYTVTRRTPR